MLTLRLRRRRHSLDTYIHLELLERRSLRSSRSAPGETGKANEEKPVVRVRDS